MEWLSETSVRSTWSPEGGFEKCCTCVKCFGVFGCEEHLVHERAAFDTVDVAFHLFFENVMVNVEDPEIRVNRLRLLGTLRDSFIRVGDIALLSSGRGST